MWTPGVGGTRCGTPGPVSLPVSSPTASLPPPHQLMLAWDQWAVAGPASTLTSSTTVADSGDDTLASGPLTGPGQHSVSSASLMATTTLSMIETTGQHVSRMSRVLCLRRYPVTLTTVLLMMMDMLVTSLWYILSWPGETAASTPLTTTQRCLVTTLLTSPTTVEPPDSLSGVMAAQWRLRPWPVAGTGAGVETLTCSHVTGSRVFSLPSLQPPPTWDTLTGLETSFLSEAGWGSCVSEEWCSRMSRSWSMWSISVRTEVRRTQSEDTSWYQARTRTGLAVSTVLCVLLHRSCLTRVSSITQLHCWRWGPRTSVKQMGVTSASLVHHFSGLTSGIHWADNLLTFSS